MSSTDQPGASPQLNASNTPNQPNSSSSQPATSESNGSAQPLSLPSPADHDQTTKIDMSTGGQTVKLDHMGPLVVNKDGTLSRISNWGEMSEIEKANTVRILGKRNMLRREALQGEGQKSD